MSLTLESLLAASTASPTRQHSRFRFLALALDLLVIVATTALAGYSRSVLDVLPGTTHDLTDNVLASAGFIVTAWLVGLAVGGAYRPALFGAGTEEYRTVLNGSLATAALVGIGCYLTQFPLSRGFYVLLFVIGIRPCWSAGSCSAGSSSGPAAEAGWCAESSSPAHPSTSTRSPACCAARPGSATPWSAV